MPFKNLLVKREYQRKRSAAKRAAWFKGKTCANCGSSENLELDHINPELKVSHRIWSWSDARIAEETSKCQPLCKDCHKAKTSADRLPPHGTNNRYTCKKYPCRCDLCKKAHAEANQKYKLASRKLQSVQ